MSGHSGQNALSHAVEEIRRELELVPTQNPQAEVPIVLVT